LYPEYYIVPEPLIFPQATAFRGDEEIYGTWVFDIHTGYSLKG
jgi:hypothetical protein